MTAALLRQPSHSARCQRKIHPTATLVMVVSASRWHLFASLPQGDHRHHVHRLDDPKENIAVLVVDTHESATQAQPRELAKLAPVTQGIDIVYESNHGGVTERPNVPVLKTGDLVRGPRVQISPPPPCFPGTPQPHMFRVKGDCLNRYTPKPEVSLRRLKIILSSFC